jgi:uncharacterized protein (TIGR03083 family)
MERTSYLASLRADADRLLAVAGGALQRPVPTCPGWTCERLVGHIGRVYRWTAGWVASGSAHEVERPPASAAVVDWARAGVDEIVAALESADPHVDVATWAGRQPAVFWPRRMAVETALHRFDAEAAVGRTGAVDAELAIEGVDELFDVLLPWRGAGAADATGTIHLHATDHHLDAPGEWLVTLSEGGLAVERTHAKGDVAVRGTASDLLLLLWNRIGADQVDVFGDGELLERWRAAIIL